MSVDLWPTVAVRLLLAVGERSEDSNGPVQYSPAEWMRERPTAKQRKRWSRWTRRLAAAGLIRRITEHTRDRVRQVRLTAQGRRWIREHCGVGAVARTSIAPLESAGFGEAKQ